MPNRRAAPVDPQAKKSCAKNRIHLFAPDFFALKWSSRNFKRWSGLKTALGPRVTGIDLLYPTE
jgi:hypothetical protein